MAVFVPAGRRQLRWQALTPKFQGMRFLVFSILMGLLSSCNTVDERGQRADAFTAMTRTQHSLFFHIETGSHSDASCNICHEGFATFREFTCVSCHEHSEQLLAPVHSEVAGYQWRSDSCYACHATDTNAAAAAHNAIFPIGDGESHGGMLCTDCHSEGVGELSDCATCHTSIHVGTAGAHGAVRDYSSASSMCKRCHAESTVLPKSQHLPFRIASGDHRRSACLACHPEIVAEKTWAADFQRAWCLDCHSEGSLRAEHSGMSRYAYDNELCQGCHPDGRD